MIENNHFDIDKELLPLIDDVYQRYSKDFGTWIEEEIKEEIETPTFPNELFKSLPKLIANPISLFQDPRERDVLLMGMLAVLSTWMPKVQGVYDKKLYAANIFVVISAPASAGKGTMYWARKLCEIIVSRLKNIYENAMRTYELDLAEYEKDKQNKVKPTKPLKQKFIITGNISSAALISCLQANIFFGLIYETEADTLSNTLNNSEWGGFSDVLRKAFHHEPVSLMRKKDAEDIEITRPFLSMLLSGTPLQIVRLTGNIEGGFFSRILFYDFPNNNIWRDVFKKTEENYEKYFEGYAIKLEQLLGHFFYDKQYGIDDIIHFYFTAEQEGRFNKWFEEKQSQLSHIYGDQIVASIKRLGVCFFRISMILSVARLIENCGNDPNIYSRAPEIMCSDTDYANSELIINTLLFHTIKIFNQVKSVRRNNFSKGKRDMFLEKLPDKFNRSKAMEMALFIGIKEKTAENYLSQFITQCKLERVEHNQYRKI